MINTKLLLAIKEAKASDTHLELAKATGQRSNNVKRAIERAIKQGLIAEDGAGWKLTAEGAAAIGEAEAPAMVQPESGAVPHNRLTPSGLNYRKTFENIAELADSIARDGLLQNLIARPAAEDPGAFEVIAGERRWRAIGKLVEDGRAPADYPVRVIVRDLSDEQVLELAILENTQREAVHPLEEAEGFSRLQDYRAARDEAPDQVTAEIAGAIGKTTRFVQRRIAMARGLSEKARAAYEAGLVDSFAMAEELARWPHDEQDELLAQIKPGKPRPDFMRDAKALSDFMRRTAPETGEQAFTLEEYERRGGVYIEQEDGSRQFASKALAAKLTKNAGLDEAERIAKAEGYKGQPIYEGRWSPHEYPYATEAPAHLQRVYIEYNPATLKLNYRHPVAAAGALKMWYVEEEKKREAAARAEREADLKRRAEAERRQTAAEAGAAPAELSAEDPAPQIEPAAPAPSSPAPAKAAPYSRRHWLSGAKARTEAVREVIERDPHTALVYALLAMLPRKHSVGMEPATRLRYGHTSADEHEVGIGASCDRLLSALSLPGIKYREDGEAFIEDPRAAAAALMKMDAGELKFLHAARIADLTLDFIYEAKPGAMPETLGVNDALPLPRLDHADMPEGYLASFTAPQLIRIAGANGTSADFERLSKSELVDLVETKLSRARVKHRPPEAQWLNKDAAEAASEALMRGEEA